VPWRGHKKGECLGFKHGRRRAKKFGETEKICPDVLILCIVWSPRK